MSSNVGSDVVIPLGVGEETEIPAGPSNATAGNNTDETGHLFFRINPPVQTQGTMDVPPNESVHLGFGDAGGLVRNEGPVPLTIVYFLG